MRGVTGNFSNQVFLRILETRAAERSRTGSVAVAGGRTLQPGEVRLAQRLLPNLDLSNIVLVEGHQGNPIVKGAFNNGNPAITIGNVIYYKSLPANFMNSSEGIRSLGHELYHVAQYQRYGVVSVFRRVLYEAARYGQDGAYQYYNHGSSAFGSRPLEAQAQIAGDYARFREVGQLPTYNIGGRQREITARELRDYARGSGLYGN